MYSILKQPNLMVLAVGRGLEDKLVRQAGSFFRRPCTAGRMAVRSAAGMARGRIGSVRAVPMVVFPEHEVKVVPRSETCCSGGRKTVRLR